MNALLKNNSREELNVGKFRWINIVNPAEADILFLAKNFHFHHLDLEDCLADNQRAKIDEYNDYLFIILHFPISNRKTKRIMPLEMDFFVSRNLLITVHENHPSLNNIFANCVKSPKFQEEFMGQGSSYLLYKIVDELFDEGFPLLDELAKNTSEVEIEVFEGDTQKDKLREILLLKKDLINFKRMIMPQRSVIASLEVKARKLSGEDLASYFDDVVDKIEKMFSVLENLKELVDSLHQTNETIISHNTNNIIKVLTVFSVIMLPLTFITGFYGMNVDPLPLMTDRHPALAIGGLMIFIVATMLGYFKYRKWI